MSLVEFDTCMVSANLFSENRQVRFSSITINIFAHYMPIVEVGLLAGIYYISSLP